MQKTFDWMKNNKELLNIGVSRAKDKLIIVGDKNAISKLSQKEIEKGENNDAKMQMN